MPLKLLLKYNTKKAEATGDLIDNKSVNKITEASKD